MFRLAQNGGSFQIARNKVIPDRQTSDFGTCSTVSGRRSLGASEGRAGAAVIPKYKCMYAHTTVQVRSVHRRLKELIFNEYDDVNNPGD